MGWWGMGKRGGISGILDAPRDDPRDMVMGDGPADILDIFKDEILTLGWTPSKVRLQEAFGGDFSLPGAGSCGQTPRRPDSGVGGELGTGTVPGGAPRLPGLLLRGVDLQAGQGEPALVSIPMLGRKSRAGTVSFAQCLVRIWRGDRIKAAPFQWITRMDVRGLRNGGGERSRNSYLEARWIMLERDQDYGLGKVLDGSQPLQDLESAKAATASLERRLVAAEAPDVGMLQDFLAEEGPAPAAGQTADHGEAGQLSQARLSPSCIVVAKDLPLGLGIARKEPTESRLLKTAVMAAVTVAAAMTGAKLGAQSIVESSHPPVIQKNDARALDREQRTMVGRGSDGRQALIDAVLKTIEKMELSKRDPVRNYEAKVNCLNKIASWTDGGNAETPIAHVRQEEHDWTFTLDNEMIRAIGMTFNASPGEPGPMPARIKTVEEPPRVEQVVVDVTLDGRPDWYRKMEAERTKEGS